MDEKARKREAEEILRRVARETETIGHSNLARLPEQQNADEDRIDRMGRRIGRTLGWIAALGLFVYLYLTYFRAP